MTEAEIVIHVDEAKEVEDAPSAPVNHVRSCVINVDCKAFLITWPTTAIFKIYHKSCRTISL